jgi:hypothetical protein
MVPMVLLKSNLYFFVRFVLDTNTDQIKTNYSDLSNKCATHLMLWEEKLKKKHVVAIIAYICIILKVFPSIPYSHGKSRQL